MIKNTLPKSEQDLEECDPEFRHFAPRRGRRNES